MSEKVSDKELNKAALIIAKLLLRTREGKVTWEADAFREVIAALADPRTDEHHFSAKLENDIKAIVTDDREELSFKLVEPTAQNRAEEDILSISLNHAYGRGDRTTPESIVYGDLRELLRLAENPKSVSEDLKLKQVMSYLDRLAG